MKDEGGRMKLVDCLWNPVAARERMLLLLSCCDSAATTVSSFRLHPYCSPPSSGFYSGTLIVFMISFRTASASSLRRIAEDESQLRSIVLLQLLDDVICAAAKWTFIIPVFDQADRSVVITLNVVIWRNWNSQHGHECSSPWKKDLPVLRGCLQHQD